MSFAYYRLPYSNTYTKVCQDDEPLMLDSFDHLAGKEGFVIAPFAISQQTPLIVMNGQMTHATVPSIDNAAPRTANRQCADAVDGKYAHDFDTFHRAVSSGQFRKLVLARTKESSLTAEPDVEQMFFTLCQDYPRAMVMLFSTPQSGTWLIASPEILVESQGPYLCTIALAGTMPMDEGLPQWSEKNKHEQHIVEQYIENTITPLCSSIIKDGPRTVRAGQLMHLRTDFHFLPNKGVGIGALAARLHPTPAVCGMPKAEAHRFILDNESIDRRYYSGFAGPLNLFGETHLYVSLRCMCINGNHLTCYAGGGIMPDSNVNEEWHETEMKVLSM